jgi:hypothetical protein
MPLMDRASRQTCPVRPLRTRRAYEKKNLLLQIYFTTVIVFIIVAQRGSGYSEVAVHVSAVGTNGNSSRCMQKQDWVRAGMRGYLDIIHVWCT